MGIITRNSETILFRFAFEKRGESVVLRWCYGEKVFQYSKTENVLKNTLTSRTPFRHAIFPMFPDSEICFLKISNFYLHSIYIIFMKLYIYTETIGKHHAD